MTNEFLGSKSGNQICYRTICAFEFDKIRDNSHFSTFNHSAGSDMNHDNSLEMSVLGSILVFFNDELHIFEKNIDF